MYLLHISGMERQATGPLLEHSFHPHTRKQACHVFVRLIIPAIIECVFGFGDLLCTGRPMYSRVHNKTMQQG